MQAPSLSDAGSLDILDLVDTSHPLARGLIFWFLTLPQWHSGGSRLVNLAGLAGEAVFGSMAQPATATSGLGRTTIRPGGWGEVRFDGSNDYMASAQNGQGTRHALPMTLMCWFLDDTPASSLGTTHRLIYWQDATHATGLVLSRNAGGTVRSLAMQNAAASTIQVGSTAVPLGWVHGAITFDGGSAYDVYLNGVSAIGESPAGITWGTTDDYFWLGAWNASGGYMTGLMDDLRLYARWMGPREVQEAYWHSRRGYPGLLNRLPLFLGPPPRRSMPVFAARRQVMTKTLVR